jgi:hypothetical protein
VALVVFAVLNPLACVWHCTLQDHLAEHGRRYVWICSAHQQPEAGDVIVDGGDAPHVSGGSLLAAVHQGVINTAISLVLALFVVMLSKAFVCMRRACATIVPLGPPPKHTSRYA